MRWITLAAGSCTLLTATVAASANTFYLHRAAVPVVVPGGTTTRVLDDIPPVAGTPVADGASIPKGTTATLASFTAPGFVTPEDLGLKIDVLANLSANLGMNGCARVTATIEQLDALGARSPLGTTVADVTVPQGGGGGTTGFAPIALSPAINVCAPPPDATVATGESIGVTIAVTNRCKSNRTVSLAYDAASAASAATFTSLLPLDPAVVRACYAKCQLAASKALAKFYAGKTTCIDRCQTAARKGGPPTDCVPPYAGATAECITAPDRGVEAKADATIVRACTVPGRCPPCYSGGDCTAHAAAQVVLVETPADAFLPAAFCDPSTNLPLPLVKCMRGTAKSLSKLIGDKAKCYDVCFANERKGRAAPGSCGPPASDPRTTECIGKAEGHATARLDKSCFVPPAVAPSCYSGPLASSAGWVAALETVADTVAADVYCGSSS